MSCTLLFWQPWPLSKARRHKLGCPNTLNNKRDSIFTGSAWRASRSACSICSFSYVSLAQVAPGNKEKKKILSLRNFFLLPFLSYGMQEKSSSYFSNKLFSSLLLSFFPCFFLTIPSMSCLNFEGSVDIRYKHVFECVAI